MSRQNSLRHYLLKSSTEKKIERATEEFNDTHEGVVEQHCKFEVDRLKRALEVSASRRHKLIKVILELKDEILELKDEKEDLENRLEDVTSRFDSYVELGLEEETIKEDTRRLKKDLDKLKTALKF